MNKPFDYNSFISPCIDLCRLDIDQNYCIGCKRTKEEIANWKYLSKKEKLKVMEELKQR